jgi:acetyltransferase-like isoleucine patch superfamily enzyme
MADRSAKAAHVGAENRRTAGAWQAFKEKPLRGAKDRLLQYLALHAPGAKTLRVYLHRLRGVEIGQGVFIGLEVLLESAYPWLVSIGDNVTISVRAVFIGHFKQLGRRERQSHEPSIRIEDNAYIGPNVTILPGVTIGRDAVVAAGSVVSRSVPPQTLVQGNPARVVAKCTAPLRSSSYEEFQRGLRFVNVHRRPPQDSEPE